MTTKASVGVCLREYLLRRTVDSSRSNLGSRCPVADLTARPLEAHWTDGRADQLDGPSVEHLLQNSQGHIVAVFTHFFAFETARAIGVPAIALQAVYLISF